MAHQYMLKIFHDPHKNPPVPPPMYGPKVEYGKNPGHWKDVVVSID